MKKKIHRGIRNDLTGLHQLYTIFGICAFVFCMSSEDLNAQSAFITTWQTTAENNTVTIPTRGGVDVTDYDFTIDWGDGTFETITGDNPNPSHTYASAGTQTIQITGTFPHFFLNNRQGANRLLSVEQWGDIQWESMESAFSGAANMVLNATDIPDLTNVTSMVLMFFRASSFNGNIGNWDVSNVTNMTGMFGEATAFNQDIGNWDVGNVTNMFGLFQGNSSFNQDISGWDVSSVTRMDQMFWRASSFNGNIGNWDVSNVTNMPAMFNNASSFNQDIGGWDVSKVIDMGGMFRGAVAFNQNLGGWDVSSVTVFNSFSFGFLADAELSAANYDALLNDWSQLSLQPGVSFHAGNSKYTEAGQAARKAIVENHNWTIIDGGLEGANEPLESAFITTWQTTTEENTVTIPTLGGADITTYDLTIDWGDGTVYSITGDDPNPTHTYASAGTQTIKINGTFPRFHLVDRPFANRLLSIEQWGNIQWESMERAFWRATNMQLNA